MEAVPLIPGPSDRPQPCGGKRTSHDYYKPSNRERPQNLVGL